jgi:cytochrome c-type biogenesis protein CcmF
VAEVGRVLLAVALVAAVGGCTAAVVAVITGRRRAVTIAATGLVVAAIALVSATTVLARAFLVGANSLVAVVDHSREGLGPLDRVMGLWGGMAGSLLLFTAATAVFAALGLRRRLDPIAVGTGCAVVAALVATSWAFADPFATLEIPALEGVGLTPILEHWAMRVHPPLVYAGMTALVVPAMRTFGALGERRLDGDWWRAVHPWLVVSWALLGIAMVLGSLWAYVELGWGGYWAWDPVENAALLPWLAVTLALHTGPGHRAAVVGPAVVAPFLLALLGATLTRSGATTSVHAFAEARNIGLALTSLLVVVTAAAVLLTVRAVGAVSGGPRVGDPAQRSARVVIGAVLVVVVVGTLYPLLRGWFGGDRLAVQGHFFSGLVGPLVVLGLLALVGRGRWPSPVSSLTVAGTAVVLALAGWRDAFPVLLAALAVGALVTSSRALVRSRRPADLAHVGLALMLVGIAGTATGAQASATLEVGQSVVVAGHEVVLRSIAVEPGPTEASSSVVATVSVDGHRRAAELVAYPERGVLLAESTMRSTPAADVQVVLRNADDGVALLMVNVSPLQQLVWCGAVTMLLGGVGAAARTGQGPSGPRRCRFDSSKESSVERGAAGAGRSVVGGGGATGPEAVPGSEA